MIVNDDSAVVSKLCSKLLRHVLTPIYDCNKFIVQALQAKVAKPVMVVSYSRKMLITFPLRSQCYKPLVFLLLML
jgi:hypothetical protein